MLALDTFLTLRFITLILWLLSYKLVKGELQVVGSPDEVVAVEGDNVVLSCHVNPPEDMLSSVLEWSKLKQSNDDRSEDVDYIYIYRDYQELLDLKTPSYFGRTSLLDNGLKHGDLSLRISNVTLADAGRYKCYIPTLDSRNHSTFVNLIVTKEKILLQNKTKTTETNTTSPTGGSSGQSFISYVLPLCIAILIQMFI